MIPLFMSGWFCGLDPGRDEGDKQPEQAREQDECCKCEQAYDYASTVGGAGLGIRHDWVTLAVDPVERVLGEVLWAASRRAGTVYRKFFFPLLSSENLKIPEN